MPAARSNEVIDFLCTAPVTCHYKSGGVGYFQEQFPFRLELPDAWEITLNKITLPRTKLHKLIYFFEVLRYNAIHLLILPRGFLESVYSLYIARKI